MYREESIVKVYYLFAKKYKINNGGVSVGTLAELWYDMKCILRESNQCMLKSLHRVIYGLDSAKNQYI